MHLQNSHRFTGVVAVLGMVLAASFVPTAKADEVHVAASYSAEHLNGLRAGFRWTDGPSIVPKSWLTAIGNPRVHWEAAVNTLVNSRNSSERINALSFSPVLQWALAPRLFLEAGIGVSLFDETRISDRELAISFQFEDRIGISWELDTISGSRLSFGYAHYSQADIQRPNDGLDLWVLSWHQPF
ncbi:acyloxyacyl hydrolase [Pseudidiomarina donghaiensis]|uniref:Acyloxyacyl hydrolase n=1 Tax=Pseudidiomarina donghaiensis TaxID=519452 RepID=A0A432XKT0_9GAMM|nr:acyloxyacyl hydrolase [Pseudidiomarina donghaiensis]RUO49303.1 acyloxyacyl hydrolase [Pseudidiomarina donghaiensis]